MVRRQHPNVLVTGTPGTGKTTTCELLAQSGRFQHVNVGDEVKSRGLHAGFDEQHGAFLLDEDAVVDALEGPVGSSRGGGVVVDHHGCDFFPERWFDLVVVLTVDNTTLWNRLEARGYPQPKIQENVQCEIMHVVEEEARDSYADGVVQVLSSTTTEEMEANVERILRWADLWEERRRQEGSDEDDDEDGSTGGGGDDD